MKTFLNNIIALILVSFASIALATDPSCGGNQCGVQTPALEFGPASGIQIGGDLWTNGQALAGADGQGTTSASQTMTLTQGTSNLETKSTLTKDLLANCTNCGDNQIHFLLDGQQSSFAGAQNTSATDNGPATSISQSLTGAQLGGTAWGRQTTNILP
ncbi:MAG: hypothetical protein RLZZ230_326 [Candidatus Parcubacteria bacterium]|jgi:hypothetical protein